jgi:hypothetical protein
MKAKLHKLMATAVLGLALVSNSIPAWAGLVGLTEVGIGYYGSTPFAAAGSMAGARYSADSVQLIGCGVYGSGQFVHCNAKDQTGRSVSCMSSDPRLMDAVKAITDSSLIYFEFQGGICTTLNVTNESRNLR